MLDSAKAIESAGYESLWVFDHFHTVPVGVQESSYEAWSLMAALAATTDHIRIGQMCTSVSYRNPAYLAKLAADIDVISGGRLEMGIGAGWYEEEYDGYGYEFPKPSIRIGQLEEGVEIMLKMWAEEEVHYDGKHFRLQGAISNPKPLQGTLPLWIAGGGEQLTLRVAAKYADYTNFGLTIDRFKHKSEVLASHCADVGRDFDEIVRSWMFNTVIDEDPRVVTDKLDEFEARLTGLVGAEQAARQRRNYDKYGLLGTPEQVVEQLRPWQQAGMSYIICYFPDTGYDRTSLDLFAKAVVPHL